MTRDCRLLIDIGGTNVRFGIARDGTVDEMMTSYRVSAFPTFEAALASALEKLRPSQSITSVAVAAAGPATATTVQITNTGWLVSAAAICTVLGSNPAVHIMNDVEAVASALPHLGAARVRKIKSGSQHSSTAKRRLAINIGTGFGSAALIETPAGCIVCPSESGHMLLGGQSLSEFELFTEISGHPITIEAILSGRGMRRLANAISARDHQLLTNTPQLDPEAQSALDLSPFDLNKTDPLTKATIRLVTKLLAETAANLTLAAAAWDGVFLCGSVATAWAETADLDQFETAFTGDAAMQHKLAQTPVSVIVDPLPSFLGLAHFAPQLS